MRSLVLAVLLLSALCLFLGYRLWRVEPPRDPGPSVRALWSNLIRPYQKTSIVVAESAFGFLQDALGPPLDLEHYLQHDPQSWGRTGQPDARLDPVLQVLAFRQYTSFGDLATARRVLEVNPSLGAQVSIVFARNYNARSTDENVILLGSQRSNPWAQLYANRLNFRFDDDEALRKAIVRNLRPRAGEAEVYQIGGEGHDIKEGYAVLAFLPDSNHTGNALLPAGTDMEATEAVGSLATTELQLAPFLRRSGVSGAVPPLEALFQTRRLGGAPQDCKLLAFRLLNN